MNVLYGLLPPDKGTISIDGVEHVPANPKEAIAAGIGMVHQHFMLVDVFTRGREPDPRPGGQHGRPAQHGPGAANRSASCRSATGSTSTRTRWSRSSRSASSSGSRS